MKITAHRGARLHAPENSRNALVSGYTGGADVLELDVQMSADEHLVVTHDGTVDRLTGTSGEVHQLTLAQLRSLDFSATFRPRGSINFHYFNPEVSGRRLQIETLPELLDFFPEDVDLLVQLKLDASPDTDRRERFVEATMRCLQERELIARTVLYSKDGELLRLARKRESEVRICAFDGEPTPAAKLDIVRSLQADGLVTEIECMLTADGQLTEFGRAFQKYASDQKLSVGAVLYPGRESGVFTPLEYESLRSLPFVWSVATDSMLDVAPFVRRGREFVSSSFAGTTVDRQHFSFGYAKANKYCRVYQDDGVHVEIAPYDIASDTGQCTTTMNELERRIALLEERMMYAERDWPFYSGGGLGVVDGIRGDFAAEVDYVVENVAQATTLEMAVLNVDPGAHQGTTPTTGRGKDSFYDPHGAPPYVGVEHDEDDGYRINWNLGSEYDSNQYGRPVGDGRNPHSARIRLERRGPYFSAYYRNSVDAPDWVCVGVARNDSLNPVVYLRCVGKRWRQEMESDPTQFQPIIPNHFVFRNLSIVAYHR